MQRVMHMGMVLALITAGQRQQGTSTARSC